jgi:hypothetical protein
MRAALVAAAAVAFVPRLAWAQVSPGAQPASPDDDRDPAAPTTPAADPSSEPAPTEPTKPAEPVGKGPGDKPTTPPPGTPLPPVSDEPPVPVEKPPENPAVPGQTVPIPPAPAPVATPPLGGPRGAPDDPLTSAAWRPHRRFDLHWQLLALPQRAVELALMPVGLLAALADEYALGPRLDDLLEFFDRRLVLSPRAKFAFGDGAGVGLWIRRPNLFDQRAEARVGGLYRLNGDYQLEAEYSHDLLFPGGRGLRMRAYLERDKNQRFYGLGGDTTTTDRRVLRSNDEGGLIEVDLQGIDRYTFSGVLQLGFRRQTLSAGLDGTYIPVGTEGDTVEPPAGFGLTAMYVDATVVGHIDTRDTIGRPTRGTFVEARGWARTDVTGKNLSSITMTATASQHFPIIDEHRVIIVTAGIAAAVPMIPGDDIPLDSLPTVGRNNVRGYDRERFRDRYGAVGSLEYRFPIYEYLRSQAGLDAFFFADGGTVWGDSKLSKDNLRYAFGGGLRAAHETTLAFQGTIGWSPEGLQINLGVEKAL